MGSDVTAGDLVGITEAAIAIGVHPRTLRRRLVFLHERNGNVLVSFGRPGGRVGKWLVRKSALLTAMREDPTTTDERLHALEHGLAELAARQLALRNSFKHHKRDDSKWKNRHQLVVAELTQALASITTATGLIAGTTEDIEDNPA